ncbi:MAG: ferrous iron transport protein B [Planctomycetes bacterium]|nr:ferrous iron transport protein B [Planctomycetota bacterium]
MKASIKVALAGNPNSGKTTIFNSLTGARQHVGNYPGVTVEKKEGTCRHGDVQIQVVDLPGTYSLSAYSIEELVARDFIVEEKPDVVVDIIDASNLERNLYLAVQIMELGVPLVLAFNMSDTAKARGYEFDLETLSELLSAPIVTTVGNKGEGITELLDAIVSAAAKQDTWQSAKIVYGKEVEEELAKLAPLVARETAAAEKYGLRWLTVKLLENDQSLLEMVSSPELLAAVEASSKHLQGIFGDPPEIVITDRRYGFISGACTETVRSTVEARHTMSDKIDTVVTNRLLGLPIFFAMMYLVFQLTFTIGDPFMGWIEQIFGWLGGIIEGFWPAGSESALKSLLVDGIIGGVGGVIVFLPNILLLFMAIAILEDSGYMARAAFIMDHLMHKIGLHGKSFIPLVIGFGCTIPAIMATRTLESRRDRLTTMLVAPLMSCGARLPIYALIIPAFFPQQWHAPMLWIIYLIGIILAIVCAKLLRATLFKGESTPFVMELPPYRVPTLRGIVIHMWDRGWMYLKKAGTIILGISILLWAMTTYPKKEVFARDYPAEIAQLQAAYPKDTGVKNAEALQAKIMNLQQAQRAEELTYSIAGRIGHGLEPLLKPMGFDWRVGTALIGAFAAKEVFVAQMGIVFSVGEADAESEVLRDRLRENYTPLAAFCIMIFCLISTPCMATIAVTRRESNSWGWALFQLGGLTALAYVLTVFVYQAGSLLSIGTG